ncbi:TIGR04211 family SH3 domain-containing protein [Reinekea marinisedimentorum]|uniref:SH3 domain protein n=1 Tax=Reinekea marinisedimentorum TaxID=230495 RepID=A0A4R3HSB4_9GAMM|nr:TIGR04211 family SH3 domain-containing protein [Reinekea marinisedimentorum]TCS35892.1 SH3 domain protein [Reinekea marinisedimentorum]
MHFKKMLKLLLIVTLFTAPVATLAETVWLRDVLYVNIRTGPSNNNRILKTITSGTRMEVLEKPDGADFYRVRTEDGLEGWIPSQYLVTEPTGDIRAEMVQAEKDQLQSQYEALEEKYNSLLNDKGDVRGELETLRTNNEQLTSELNRIKAVSGDALNMDVQLQQISEENAIINTELDVLKAENQSLREYNDNILLLAGGGLTVFGIILGFILPHLTGNNKRRKDGWS